MKSIIFLPDLRKPFTVFRNALVNVAFAAQCLGIAPNAFAVTSHWEDVIHLELLGGAAAATGVFQPLSALPSPPGAGCVPVGAVTDLPCFGVTGAGAEFARPGFKVLEFLPAPLAGKGLLVSQEFATALNGPAGSTTPNIDSGLEVLPCLTADRAGDCHLVALPPSVFSVAGDGTIFASVGGSVEFEFAPAAKASSGFHWVSHANLHNFIVPQNTSFGVLKPSLIDLEAQTWATGGKVTAAADQPERLSGTGAITRMRQSGLQYNVRLKLEREVEVLPRQAAKSFVCNIYTENATFKYYSGYETLDISPSDIATAAEYNWKQAAVAVTASGLEVEVQNSGKEAVIDLLDKRIGNAFRTMKNQISSGIYSDGTGTSSKQITGLQAQVADDPTTGTVGGIDRSTWTFWRNNTKSNATWTSAVIQGYMQNLWLQCCRGSDKPDLITADIYTYEIYWDALQAIQRITREDKGMQGWASLAFLTADVIYDGDSGHPAYGMYFLNTDFLFFRPHVNRNFVPLKRREATNQDAFVVPIVFAGNLTMSNADLQGVLFKTNRA